MGRYIDKIKDGTAWVLLRVCCSLYATMVIPLFMVGMGILLTSREDWFWDNPL